MKRAVYLKKKELLLISVPIFIMMISANVIQNILVVGLFAVVLNKVCQNCPKNGYVVGICFSRLCPSAILSVLIGIIFYLRWIPAGILIKIGNIIGISNSFLLIQITSALCIPLTLSIALLLEVMTTYTEQKSELNLQSKRLDGLEIVRAFACIEVFCCHYHIAGTGALGVSLFFVMSGFLLIYNHLNDSQMIIQTVSIKKNVEYAYKKIKTLYPLHLMMLVVAIIMQMRNESEGLLAKTVSQALLLHAWIPNSDYFFSLNNISWYLSAGLFTYFCFPWICSVIRKYKSSKNAFMAMGGILILQCVFGFFVGFVLKLNEGMQYYIFYICPILRLGDFIIGCNLGYLFLLLREKKIINHWRYIWLELFAILLLWFSEYMVLSERLPEAFRYSIGLLPVSVITVWCFAVGQGFLSCGWKCNRILLTLAQLSPYIYLVHVMMRNVLRFIIPSMEGTYFYASIGFMVSVLIALLYKNCVQKDGVLAFLRRKT